MVAVVNTGYSISRALNYNEQKVKEGKAACIAAGNYPMDKEAMNFHHKLNYLKRFAELNENVRRNCVHISLNFDPSEKFSEEKLGRIAADYMRRIGFGDQPYLVYEHTDAGHPHLHLVSVKVKADANRIDTQNIGRNQSRSACEAIEDAYGLIKAKGRNSQKSNLALSPARVVQYGKSELRRSIGNVLTHVLNKYHYESLPELNAALRGYNVVASRCNEGTRTYRHNGLIYQALDERGNPIGKPIKASLFYNNPGWEFLQDRFQAAAGSRQHEKAQVRVAIDRFFRGTDAPSLTALSKDLERRGIRVVLRTNADDRIYGITFVDHNTRCVFNGSALGKQYSVAALQQRCAGEQEASQQKTIREDSQSISQPASAHDSFTGVPNAAAADNNSLLADTVAALTTPTSGNDYVDPNLKKKKKKQNKTSPRL